MLRPGQLGVTLAAGGGGVNWGRGAGGGGRVRVGVGARQELGAEGTVLYAGPDNHQDPLRPWQGGHFAGAAKLTWKVAPLPWLAFLAGAGGARSVVGTTGGGDLAAITSTSRLLANRWRPYGGARGVIAVPVGRSTDDAGGITEGLIVAIGTTYALHSQLALALEFGEMRLWSRGYQTTADDPMRAIESKHARGNYLLLGMTLLVQ